MRISRKDRSDIILGSYTSEEYISPHEKSTSLRREVYDTDPRSSGSLQEMIDKITQRSLPLQAISDHYNKLYELHQDDRSLEFRKETIAALLVDIQQADQGFYHLVKAQHRGQFLDTSNNFINLI